MPKYQRKPNSKPTPIRKIGIGQKRRRITERRKGSERKTVADKRMDGSA